MTSPTHPPPAAPKKKKKNRRVSYTLHDSQLIVTLKLIKNLGKIRFFSSLITIPLQQRDFWNEASSAGAPFSY